MAELDARQAAAAANLASGTTELVAAQAAGVSKRTVQEWKVKVPEFLEAVNSQRRENVAAVTRYFADKGLEAAELLAQAALGLTKVTPTQLNALLALLHHVVGKPAQGVTVEAVQGPEGQGIRVTVGYPPGKEPEWARRE